MNLPVFIWIVLALIWGSTWLFIKLGLQDLPPLTFAGIRFVIAVLILGAFIKTTKRPVPRSRRDWNIIAITGLLTFSINYGLVFWGENLTPSGLAAVLHTMIPAFGLVIAHFYLPGERVTAGRMLGVALGIIGVVIIFSDQLNLSGKSTLIGSAAILAGAFAIAFANILVKAKAGHIDPAVLAAGQMSFGLVPLLAAGWYLEGSPFSLHWTTPALVSLFYLAIVGSSVAFLLYYWLVRHMEVTRTMLISLVTPVIALLLGRIFFNEQLSWRTAVGTAAILAGIALIASQRTRRNRALARAKIAIAN